MATHLTDLQARIIDESLHELGLPVRIINALETHAKVFSVRDLLQLTPDQVLSLPNFGEKTLKVIYLALAKFGFYCSDSDGYVAETQAAIDARRKQLRDAVGASAVNDRDAIILYEQAGKRKRKPSVSRKNKK